jgi:hypothetical protein
MYNIARDQKCSVKMVKQFLKLKRNLFYESAKFKKKSENPVFFKKRGVLLFSLS